MVNVEQIITNKSPSFANKPLSLRRSLLFFLRKLVHEHEVNQFLAENSHCEGYEFIDRVLDYFNFSYNDNKDRINIPDSGRVVIIANHPVGALDGLVLVDMH